MPYLIIHFAMGYGTYQMIGVYSDPISEPREWLIRAASNLTPLVGALMSGIDGFSGRVASESSLQTAHVPPIVGALVCFAIAAVLIFVVSRARGTKSREDCLIAWQLLGTALSLIPVLGTLVGPRVLLLPAFGVCGCLALLGQRLASSLRSHVIIGQSKLERMGVLSVAITVLFLRILLPPLAIALNTRELAALFQEEQASFQSRTAMIQKHLSHLRHEQRHVIALTAPWILSKTDGATNAVDFLSLSLGEEPSRFVRIGEKSFRLSLLQSATPRHFNHTYPAAGDSIAIWDRAVIEVLEGAPSTNEIPPAFEVRFPVSLDDPSLEFVTCEGSGIKRFQVPAAGQSAALPACR